ncbi:Hypothetical predicted protein [Cloeon dipterum]|uniref:Uncharacterized protein n=1 Tax=Cloeon dipterum TaxID=197152 RepID=A0A8S1DA51_9INSE|nr:Hypothetical predicted protein [Cloeon dipterum]
MSEINRLEMARVRLINLKRSRQSLLELATNKVSSNIRFFVQPTERKRLERLVGPLRDRVLRKLMNIKCHNVSGNMLCFLVVMEALPLLLSTHTREFSFDWLMSLCSQTFWPHYRQEVLRLIVNLAPKIRTLTMNSYSSILMPVLKPIKRNLLTPITKMKNLQKLELSTHSISFESVLRLCKSLRFLQSLSVTELIFEEPQQFNIEAIKKQLSRLRVFKFAIIESQRKYWYTLRRICTENLPNLLILVGDVRISQYYGGYRDMGPECILRGSKTSKLRHLFTSSRQLFATCQSHRLFPDVTHLMILWERNWNHSELEVKSLLQFTKIECLCFYYVPSSEIFERFLKTYGRNLRTLYLMSYNVPTVLTFSAGKLFRFCPKLETLFMTSQTVFAPDQQTIQFFAELKNFAIYCHTEVSVLSFLSAPKLEKLCLNGNLRLIRDAQKVSTLIAEKKIFQQLETLEVICCTCSDLGTPTLTGYETIFEFLKDCIAFLPKLDTVVYNFEYVKMYQLIREIEQEGFGEFPLSPKERMNFAQLKMFGYEDLFPFLCLPGLDKSKYYSWTFFIGK